MPLDDAELLAKAGQGDQAAFMTLYDRYEADLFRFVFYLAGASGLAEDLYQDTWLRIVRYSGRKPVCDFRKWAFTIAANRYRDEIRKQKIRRLVMGNAAVADDYTDAAAGVDRQAIVVPRERTRADNFIIRDELGRAMQRLSERQRTVFVLVYIEGFKIHEVSEMIGKAEGTVKSTLHQTLKKLREDLKGLR